MRNLLIIILLVIGVLTACGENNESSTDNLAPSEKLNNDIEEVVKDEEIEETNVNETSTDLVDVFSKMKDASKDINTFAISGTSTTTTMMAGATNEETIELSGEIQLEPFAQHLKVKALSGEAMDSEMYIKDLTMYVHSEDMDGWLKMVHGMQEFSIVSVLQEKQLDFLIANKDAFELTQDETHYIIDFIGTDDDYKEIVYGGLMRMETLAGELSEIIDKMDVTGSIKLYVAKDTYLVEKQESNNNATTFDQLEIHSIDEGVYTITDYNTIEEITVPQEVIENAIELPSPTQFSSPG